jgi:hypothetical protein
MADLAFVLLTVAFFGTVALVARHAAARETAPESARSRGRES